MRNQRVARRRFLAGAAFGAGTIAGAKLLPEASAQINPQHAAATAPLQAHAHSNGEGHGAFFNDADAETVAAFAERLMPGAPGKPGARDAGVLNYIDLALAGAYADQQDFYRRGFTQLDAFCRKTYGQPFVRLAAAQQDEVIRSLEEGKADGLAGRPRRRSSTRSARTRWRGCSPTRSTAATRTLPGGG